jgi:LysR family transcriptional activator of nhaA
MMVPKLVVYHLLRPALDLEQNVELVCEEGPLPDLLSRLSLHQLDVVLSDAPLGPELNIRAFNHLLGSSTMTVFAPTQMARKLRRRFPESLDGCPFLMPITGTVVRRHFDTWLASHKIAIKPVGSFADSALIKVFGQNGAGAFLAPTAISESVASQFACQPVAEIPDFREQYFAITVDRRIKHPAVVAISEAARNDLFA